MLIKAGLLIDGTGEQAVVNRYFSIDQGKISAIGQAVDFAVADVQQAFDLSEYTIMPGLIDTHAHLFLEGIYDLKERGQRWTEDKDFTLMRAVKNLQMTLKKGVTTVRDLGGPYNIASQLKKAVRRNVLAGPTIITARQAISITGGHFHYAGGCEADGAEEMVKAVRAQVKAGADCIKVMMTGCVNFVEQNAGIVELTVEETRALVSEAQRMGKLVSAHANGSAGVRQALLAGINTIEHGALLVKEDVQFLAESEAYWVPTLLPFQRMFDYSCEYESKSLPRKGLESVYSRHRSMVEIGIAQGAKIVAGTDAGALGVEHGDVWWELALLVEGGLSPQKAIQAATGLAAQAIGLDAQIGTITLGKQADFIVVAGNPLEDIRCLRKIHKVFKAGREVFVQ